MTDQNEANQLAPYALNKLNLVEHITLFCDRVCTNDNFTNCMWLTFDYYQFFHIHYTLVCSYQVCYLHSDLTNF